MEWYYGGDIEDLAVPKDEEMFDRLPSPDSWSSWGKIVGNFNSQKKLTLLGVEDFLLSESEVERLSAPSVCHGSRHDFRQRNVQLNDLSTIDEADDIFFRSIFEADARATDGADSSVNCTQTSSKDDVMTIDHFGERDHIQDCMDNVGHFPPAKKPEFEICVSEEHSDASEDIIDEDMSTEESVLTELQTLTVQLAKKTRVCFRDSLYRLAENSRHQTRCGQNEKEDAENCKTSPSVGPSRLRESLAKKSDTNAIDRTVATLLFNTMKCCNYPAASSSGLNGETLQIEYQTSPFYQPGSYNPAGDAEVPTFGLTNQSPPPPKGDTNDFSIPSLMWA